MNAPFRSFYTDRFHFYVSANAPRSRGRRATGVTRVRDW